MKACGFDFPNLVLGGLFEGGDSGVGEDSGQEAP
jgi:hypothetical protein